MRRACSRITESRHVYRMPGDRDRLDTAEAAQLGSTPLRLLDLPDQLPWRLRHALWTTEHGAWDRYPDHSAPRPGVGVEGLVNADKVQVTRQFTTRVPERARATWRARDRRLRSRARPLRGCGVRGSGATSSRALRSSDPGGCRCDGRAVVVAQCDLELPTRKGVVKARAPTDHHQLS